MLIDFFCCDTQLICGCDEKLTVFHRGKRRPDFICRSEQTAVNRLISENFAVVIINELEQIEKDALDAKDVHHMFMTDVRKGRKIVKSL